jgi:HEAT repeat protein
MFIRSAHLVQLAMLLAGMGLAFEFGRDVRADDETVLRKWRWGTDGKLTMEGRLIAVDNGFAKIRNGRGKVSLIPLERLFPEDREYVENWVKLPVEPATKKGGKTGVKQSGATDEPPEIPPSDKERIELAKSTREWQKHPLDAKAMAMCLAQLMSPDADQRKHTMTRLAISKPNEKHSAEVARLSKESQSVVGKDFHRKMYPQVCDSWEGYAQAILISRRAKNVQGLEMLVVNGNGLERSQAIAALKFLMTAEAAGILVERFTVSPLACSGALTEMGPVAAPAVVTMLGSSDAELRRKGLDILEEIGGEEQHASVRKLLTDPDPQVRIAATKAVKAIEQRMK